MKQVSYIDGEMMEIDGELYNQNLREKQDIFSFQIITTNIQDKAAVFFHIVSKLDMLLL